MEHRPLSVSRSVELPVPAEEAWVSLRDAAGLSQWLGERVELEVVPGAAGTVTDGGATRRVVVTAVEDGRSIGLVWWDEAAPEDASVVTIDLAPGSDDTTTVTVTERRAGAAVASVGDARVGDLSAVESSWDQRLQALVGASALAPACV